MRKHSYALLLLLVEASILMLFGSCKTAEKICVDKTVSLSAKLPEDVSVGLLKRKK